MSRKKPTEEKPAEAEPAESDRSDLADDILWGGEKIAEYLGMPVERFYYLNARGAFGDAVRKHTHRIITGSKRGLQKQFTAA